MERSWEGIWFTLSNEIEKIAYVNFAWQVFVDTLVKKAYENWMHVIEYDGKSLLGFDQNKSSDAFQNDLSIHPQDQPNSFDQLTLPCLPASVPAEHPPMNPGLTIGGN